MRPSSIIVRVRLLAQFLLLVIPILLALTGTGMAQGYLYGIGTPSYSTAFPIENGFINISNGNIHLEISLGNALPQRGTLTAPNKLVYDGRIWKIVPDGSGNYSWQPTNVPNSQGGWRYVDARGTLVPNATQAYCDTYPPTINATIYTWSWAEPNGTVHGFPLSTWKSHQTNNPCYDPSTDVTSGDALADDSSGFHLYVTNYTTVVVRAKDGTQVFPALEDANGNQFTTDSNGSLHDTLNRIPVLVSSSGNQTYYDVLTWRGNRDRYTVTTIPVNVATNFKQTAVTEYAGTFSPIQSILLPDGTSYSFTYDSDTAAGNYGEITSVTLPTGGKIVYGYTNYLDSYQNQNRWVSYRLTTAGIWNFTPQVISNCTSGGTGCKEKVIVTSPAIGSANRQDDTDYTFVLNNGAWNSQIDYYSGTGSGRALLQSRATSYDFSLGCGSSCVGSRNIRAISNILTLANGKTAQTLYSYDGANAQYGNVTAIKEWDYYTGTQPAPYRETDYTYSSDPGLIGRNILDKVTSIVIKDSAQILQSQSQFYYDETALATVSGIAQHDDQNYSSLFMSRGNLTTAKQWLNGGAPRWIATTYAYDELGNLRSKSDPLGAQTQYAYSSTFANGYVTQTQLPATTSSLDHSTITHSLSVDYDLSSGLVVSRTDDNGQQTAYDYDNHGRLITVTPPSALGKTNFSYPDAITVVQTDQISTSVSRTSSQVRDVWGRLTHTSRTNGEGGLTQQDTCYDSRGNVGFVSYPYVTGTQVCSGAGDAFSYDGLGRNTSITHSDGSSSTASYNGSAVLLADERGIARVVQTDAFGRVKATCEVTSQVLTGSGNPSACGLDYSAVGYLTTFAYDVSGNLTQVNQGNLAPRSKSYDTLGRLVSESMPEMNGSLATTFYTYDDSGNLATRVRPAANQLASASPLRVTTTTYSHDIVGRLLGKTYDDGITPAIRYYYDEAGPWGYSGSFGKGRITSEYVDGLQPIKQMYIYDNAGNVVTNRQATPSTFNSNGYAMDYVFNLDRTLSNVHNGATNITYSYSYDASGQRTGIVSSLNDATHPANLLSQMHYSPAGLVSAVYGNNVSHALSYTNRLLLQSSQYAATRIQGAIQSSGSIVLSGSEQVHQVPAKIATAGAGTVTLSGSLQSKQVTTQQATKAQATVTISGSVKRMTPSDCPPHVTCYVYDSGAVSVGVNGVYASASYTQGVTSGTLAATLSNAINANGSYPATASASGGVLTLTSKATGVGANYPLSVGVSYDDTDFSSPSFTLTRSGANLNGGQNAVTSTVYDSGTLTITVNGHSTSVGWGQGATASGISSALAVNINQDAAAAVSASATGSAIYLTARTQGASTNYVLSSSCSYDSSNFGGPSFTASNSGATLVGGADAVQAQTIYDSGLVAVTIGAAIETSNYGSGSTPTQIASDLAQKFNADVSSPVTAVAAGSALTFTSRVTGSGTNYAINASASSNQSQYFSAPSFNASSGTMTGGADGGSTSTPLYTTTTNYGTDSRLNSTVDSIIGNPTYSYDGLAHLSGASNGPSSTTWDFDRYGNRWHQNGPFSPQEIFDTNNHGNDVTYDVLGNVISEPLLHSYTYDAENRIVAVDNGVTATYTYDGVGRRVRKSTVSGTYEYVYDLSGNAVAELNTATGNWTRAEIYNDDLHIGTYANSGTLGTYFSHVDWEGTERIRTDWQGNVVQQCSSLLYGDGLSCTGNEISPIHFTGYIRDGETQLDYANLRYYNSRLGRFMSPDIMEGDASFPQSFNRYTYVRGDPANYVDPSGAMRLEIPTEAAAAGSICGPECFAAVAIVRSLFELVFGGGHPQFHGSLQQRPGHIEDFPNGESLGIPAGLSMPKSEGMLHDILGIPNMSDILNPAMNVSPNNGTSWVSDRLTRAGNCAKSYYGFNTVPGLAHDAIDASLLTALPVVPKSILSSVGLRGTRFAGSSLFTNILSAASEGAGTAAAGVNTMRMAGRFFAPIAVAATAIDAAAIATCTLLD